MTPLKFSPRLQRRSLMALALQGASAMAWAQAAGAAGPLGAALQRPALTASHTARAVLLGAALAGRRLVAAGERGLVLTSDDAGQTWQQRATPVSVTLTAVRFADAHQGVAVGHSGVVLLTQDGGSTWRLALDGLRAASLVLEAARADAAGGSVASAAALQSAERLVADGADKPLLDVCISGPGGRNIIVVGAYGLALASADAGHSWQPWLDRVPNPRALHLYAVRCRGDVVLMAGEQGLALRSEDGGRSFRRLETPYKGSFFTAELLHDDELVLAGLRGNALLSRDGGRAWVPLANPLDASITASLVVADGRLLLADQAGHVLRREGERLQPLSAPAMPPITGLVLDAQQRLTALTLQGAMPVSSFTAVAAAPASAL